MGNRFHVYVTVFMRERLFPCVGGQLHAWEVVGVGGIIVARGVVSCDSARMMVWSKGAYHIPEQ